MKSSCTDLKPSRRRIARIRCVDECIQSFKENKCLPDALCYIAKENEYTLCKPSKLTLYSEPDKSKELKTVIPFSPSSPVRSSESKGESNPLAKNKIFTSGEEQCNSNGQWARFIRHVRPDGTVEEHGCEGVAWVHLYSNRGVAEDTQVLVPCSAGDSQPTAQELLQGVQPKPITSWEEVIEHRYAVHLGPVPPIAPAADEAIKRLSTVPHNWNLDHDEELAQFLCHHLETDNEHLGTIKNYVEAIKVSSFAEEDEGVENLTDGDPDTYWESDGNQGEHCITMTMKKGTIIKQLIAQIDGSDDNYMPLRFTVKGGELGFMKQISDVHVDQKLEGPSDVIVLEDQREHYHIIEIWIKECKDDGIDTRIHGIKLKSTMERDLGLNKDLFSSENLVRFPKIESFDAEILYRRAMALQRFVILLDSVLAYIVPTWEYSVGSFTSLEVVRQLLPLSKKRMSLVEKFLRDSETGGRMSVVKRLYINRRAAAEHKTDPSTDPLCKNSVFNQVFEGLKPRERTEKPLDYRWSARFDQWWECKFIGEGIIDQGGGFRDSLSDIAEELCPSSSDVPIPLPYFIRSPNHNKADLNTNRDVYIPNPTCDDFAKYEWIGKLMGACFRGKENLVLILPPFVWKKLSEERVTWLRDYTTIDEFEARILENMVNMDEDSFNAYFIGERSWSTVLCGGNVVNLKDNETESTVAYTERIQYTQLVKQIKMSQFDKQIDAIRQGFLQVIPKAVLDLLTWQELEKRICGNPEITIAALRHSTHYEDMEVDDIQAKYLWEALEAFSNEDRSRFLRFVTGRRRLPAPIYICLGKGVDCLPESSTCSNTIYLPNYSSAKVAEEKLRYAAYNCVAIDTDMSPWDAYD